MEEFVKLKLYLKQLSYPHINVMDDSDVIEVLNTSNRKFLLIWIFKQLGESYNKFFYDPTAEDVEDVLAELVYENGFCGIEENVPFIKGDMSLPINKQITIFSNIFDYIIKLIDAKKCEIKESSFMDEFVEFVNTDVNLFPMLGEIKLRTPKNRAEKLVKCQQEYNHYKGMLEHPIIENNFDLFNTDNIEDTLLKTVDKSEAAMKMFKNKCTHKVFIPTELKLRSHTEEEIERCRKNLEKVAKFVGSIEIMNRALNNNDDNSMVPKEDNENRELIKELAVISKTVVYSMKD